MIVRPAEESFQKGVAALAHGARVEALALFEAAIQVERQLGVDDGQARYLSYYGMCLALEGRKTHEGTKLCREALAKEFFNADLHLNLGRALLASGKKKEAWTVLQKGLGWERRHAGILKAIRAMGRRRRPVLPFLSRHHPINVMLGRISKTPGVTPARA